MTPVYSNFIFDEPRGFVFAYVPKVACTNWKAVLRHLAGHTDYLDPGLAHDKVAGGLRYLDLTGEDRRLLSDPGIRKYGFVRNPYTRILSAYLNKIEQNLDRLLSASAPALPGRPNSHWLAVAREIDAFRRATLDCQRYPEVGFEVFLLWLRDGKSSFRADEHWQTQSILLRWPEVKFDFIGRFENLAADSKALLDLMGATIDFPTQKQVKFLGTGASERAPLYFTDASHRLCDQLFRPDFDNFGYPMARASQTSGGGA